MTDFRVRVWDKVNKKMYYKIDNMSLISDVYFYKTFGRQRPRSGPDDLLMESLDRFVFMRPTGLKDKKGVDIWDGDIVTYKVGTERTGGPVRYMAEFANWVKGNNQNLGSYKKTTEVTGNIYENRN